MSELKITSLLNDADLQGYWRLESNGVDETANDNDLTAVGSPSHVTGKYGNGADLELNTPDYYHIADGDQTGLDLVGDFTFSAWVKVESLDAQMVIISKNDTGFDERSYDFRLNVAGKPYLLLSDDGDTVDTHYVTYITDDGHISVGTWVHVAVTFDISEEECIFYINGDVVSSGQLAGTTIGASLHNSSADFAIGARYNSGAIANTFDGIIDDVAVFSRVLSGDEIRLLGWEQRNITSSIGISDSSAGVTDYNRSLESSIALSDSIVKITDYSRSVQSSLGITDTISYYNLLSRILSDSFGVSDAVSKAMYYQRINTDSFSVDDSITRIADYQRSTSSSLGITDTVARTLNVSRVITDNISIDDVIDFFTTTGSKIVPELLEIKNIRPQIYSIQETKPQITRVEEIKPKLYSIGDK